MKTRYSGALEFLKTWRLNNACPLCDMRLSSKHKLPVCQQCFAELPWCEHSGNTLGERSAFYYQSPIQEYILAGKSGQVTKLQLLGELMAIHFGQQVQSATGATPQAIIPVPLHKTRLRQRGFNQAIELIRPLARQHNIPLLRHAVYRNRHTGEQKGLTESMRQTNIADAFSLRSPLQYQHIAIFDDVITTGATCNVLRDLLLKHGAKTVEVWCCATTQYEPA